MAACGGGNAPNPGFSESPQAAAQKQAGETPTANLPEYRVAGNTDISNANMKRRRIEIHVTNPNLTKGECRALVSAYRNRAGTEGQVSVRKPDKEGELQPWCVDNMDRRGIIFNDFYFE